LQARLNIEKPQIRTNLTRLKTLKPDPAEIKERAGHPTELTDDLNKVHGKKSFDQRKSDVALAIHKNEIKKGNKHPSVPKGRR